MPCRFCNAEKTECALSHEDWLKNARTSGDERKKMAELLEGNHGLDFGDIVACRRCGFLSVEKVPVLSALGDFYLAYYANRSYDAKQDKKIKRAMRRINRLANRTEGNRFLDVGCNLGFAVEAARCLGMNASGIDIDRQSVSMARSRFPHCRFEAIPVQDVAVMGKSFDIVYCTEVIEHIPDFKSFAKALAGVVAKGGVLFLTTPDAGHFLRPKDLVAWREVKPPEHLQWFSKVHLRKMFEAEGLKVYFPFSMKPGIRMIAARHG